MCSHYQAVKKAEQMEKFFRARGLPPLKADMWPKYQGIFVRRAPGAGIRLRRQGSLAVRDGHWRWGLA